MANLPFLFIAALWTLTPVTLHVFPTYSLAPASFRALVIVPRHADNRWLCLSYAGPEDRRSCQQLDGEQSRRSYLTFWNIRVSGEYEAVAELLRVENGRETIYREVTGFRVIGRE